MFKPSSALWFSSVVLVFAACASYEEPAMLGYGAAYGGPTEQGGTSAGSVSVTGGNAPSGKAGTSTGTAGTVSSTAGSGGSAAGNGGVGGASGGGGAGGATAAGAGGSAGGGAGGVGAGGACANCDALAKALVHRYDFEGTGAAVMDRVGTKHGSLQGGAMLATIGGKGVANLGGGAAGAYVDLPNALVSTLTNATLEAWVTWGGGNAWQRVFDFGDSTDADPEDHPANGKSYLFLTPMTDAGSGGAMRAVYSLDGGAAAAETRAEGAQAMPQALTQVVVVVDATNDKLSIYMDGAPAGEQAFTGSLSSVNDVNAWLGRSQYETDEEFNGTFHDFRIYNAALTAPQIATSFAGGPDPAFLAE